MLGLIALKGKVVTADAARTAIAARLQRSPKARRRLLPGAEGQPGKLLSDARSCFGKLSPDHLAARQDEAGHGRKETRTGTVIPAKGLAEHHDFPGLRAFGRIE